jgi:hypothetical protein
MATERKAWDRHQGEGEEAHGALMAYLELGAGRSDEKAALAVQRDRQLIRRWRRRWNWQERAAEWDRHFLSAYTAGAEKAVKRRGRDWGGRFGRSDEQAWEFSQALKRKARAYLKSPTHQVTVQPEGKGESRVTKIYEPIGTQDVKRAGEIYRLARELEQEVRRRVMPDLQAPTPFQPVQARPEPGQAAGQDLDELARARAAEGIQKWRSEQNLKLLQVPTSPPDRDSRTG